MRSLDTCTSTVSLLRRGLPSTSLVRCLVHSVDIVTPLLDIWTQKASIIGQKSIDFSLHVSCLGVDSTAAGEELRLLTNLPE